MIWAGRVILSFQRTPSSLVLGKQKNEIGNITLSSDMSRKPRISLIIPIGEETHLRSHRRPPTKEVAINSGSTPKLAWRLMISCCPSRITRISCIAGRPRYMAHWSRVQQLVGGASAATLETGKCTYKDETRQHTTTYCCHAANESGTDATFFQVGVRPLGRETLAASACRDGCSFVCVGRGMQEQQ